MRVSRRVKTWAMWPLADDCPHWYRSGDDADGGDLEHEMTEDAYLEMHPEFYEDAGAACQVGEPWTELLIWDPGLVGWGTLTIPRVEADLIALLVAA